MVATGLDGYGSPHRHLPPEKQLQATLNVIPVHAWYALPNGALTFVNERTAEYLGLAKDHPLRFGTGTDADWDSHVPLLHPDDREEMRRVCSRCLRTGCAGEVSFRLRNAEGGYRWFLSRAEPVRAANGTLLYWVGVNVDIEERKQAEFYLSEGQQLAHLGSWAFSPAGFEYWSPELFQIHGLDPRRTPPTKEEYLALVHPEDREFVEQQIQEVLRNHRAFDFTKRIVRPDGKIRSVRCVGVPGTQGATRLGFVGTGIDVTEQQQLTLELQRREADLAEAQRLSHTGSFGWNVSNDEHFWSDETFRIFEFAPASKVTLKTILDCIHPQDMPSVHTAIAAANRAEAIDLEFRLLMPDGRIKYLHVVGKAERAETGNIEVIGAVMDVTVRKVAEEAIRRSDAYLAEAQKLSHTGSFGWKPDSGEIVWSDETYRIFEYDRAEKPSLNVVFQRVHPQDKARAQQIVEDATASGTDFEHECRLLMPGGEVKHLHVLAQALDDSSGKIEFVGAVTDITERKTAEEKIRQQDAEVRQMLDFAPQLIGVLGPRLERLYANRAALAYYGVSLDEWRQTNHKNEIHPDDVDRVKAQFERSLMNGAASELEIEKRLRGGDGTYRWFLVRYNPLRDDQGQIVRWYIAGTDIEDRKRHEDKLQQENVALREEIDKTSMFEEIVGGSPALTAVLSQVSKVAGSDSTVLISGETGTGKELVARAIHRRSRRASRGFVAVNCAAIPRDLIASELFGHEKGAFTGAMQRRVGRFELADCGTIFLDEVGELASETQVALLRVLQEREFERVGGQHPIRVDVRVIAATNRDLKAAVASGAFREDLYYRLNVFPLEMPPLRARKPDIPLLVEYFIDRYARKAGKDIRSVDKKTLQLLQAYPWPGNIRELQNVIERSVIVCESETFTVDESWLSQRPLDATSGNKLFFSEKLAATEREIVEEALRESQGRIFGPSGAAARLGIARSTLESKIRSLNINKNRFKPPSGT